MIVVVLAAEGSVSNEGQGKQNRFREPTFYENFGSLSVIFYLLENPGR